MIKINLATKKGATASTATSGGGTAAGTIGFKTEFNLESVKSFPILKLIIALGAVFLAETFTESWKKEELDKIQDLIQKETAMQIKLRGDLVKTKGYEEIKKALEADELLVRSKIEVIQKLIEDRQTPPKLLRSVATATPADVWLTHFALKDQVATFSGGAVDYGQISDFLKNLSTSTYFGEVNLEGSKQEKDEKGVQIATFLLKAKRKQGL